VDAMVSAPVVAGGGRAGERGPVVVVEATVEVVVEAPALVVVVVALLLLLEEPQPARVRVSTAATTPIALGVRLVSATVLLGSATSLTVLPGWSHSPKKAAQA
jgi:hypothetical protein